MKFNNKNEVVVFLKRARHNKTQRSSDTFWFIYTYMVLYFLSLLLSLKTDNDVQCKND